MRLMGFSYTVQLIPGDENAWADMLSRWGGPEAPVRAIKRL